MNNLRGNTLWMVAGDVGSRVFGLVFGVILARLLLPEDFGLVITAQIVTGAFGYIAAGGMSDALIRSREITKRDRDTVFTFQLTISLAIFALLQVIAPYFALLFKDPRLELVLRVAALSFIARPFMYVPLAILQREMRFKEASILLFVTIMASGSASTLMALYGLGVYSLVIGGLVGAVVRIAILMIIAPWIPACAWDHHSVRRLGAFGIRVSIIDFIQFLQTQANNALVSRSLGVRNVGLYNKADSLAEMPFEILSISAFQTLFRALSIMQSDIAGSAQLFIRSITLVSLYALPCYVGLIWVARPLVLTLFGANWEPTVLPLQVLCVAGIFRIITNLSGAVTAAQDRLAQEIRIRLQTLGLTILGVLGGMHWGIVGVAVGVLPGLLYSALRMYALAGSALALSWGNLARSLAPVLWLNLVLSSALAVGRLILVEFQIGGDEPQFLAAMVLIGVSTYAGHFLFFPPTSLRGESQRWRDKIGAYSAMFVR